MGRPHTILQAEFSYNVGARCINKDWFSIPMNEVWEIMSEHLNFIHHGFDARIQAFVLMSNHYHMLLRTPLANIDHIMAWFNRETSRTLTRAGNRINQTYGGKYFRSVITSPHYFLNAYKYTYYNPVKAGICANVLDYPYSTLPGLLGRRKILIPVQEDLILFSDVEGTLSWLNRAPSEKNWKAVRAALHRPEFYFAKLSGRPHPLEVNAL